MEERAGPGSWNLKTIEEFRANGGKVGGPFEGAPLVLLTATGARGGAPHTTPADLPGRRRPAAGARLQRGADTNPAWYHNVLADPEVTVEQGTDTYTATATPVGGAERGRLSAHQAGLIPVYAQYQAMTTRRIPAVELRRQTND